MRSAGSWARARAWTRRSIDYMADMHALWWHSVADIDVNAISFVVCGDVDAPVVCTSGWNAIFIVTLVWRDIILMAFGMSDVVDRSNCLGLLCVLR